MIYEKTSLRAGGRECTLTAILPDNSPEIDPARRRKTIIICPGGGYKGCSDREGEPVAIRFAAEDYNTFVLRYSTGEDVRYPTHLRQLAAAVMHIRANADRYHVKPDGVYVMGFSAGAHLAASLGVRWKETWLSQELDTGPETLRPAGMILAYPVITGGAAAHRGCMEILTGSADETAWGSQSLEELVDAHTPETFLWSTFDDATVPVENSLLFAQRLQKAGVNTELHIFSHGIHGASLGNATVNGPAKPKYYENQALAMWVPLALNWLGNR